MILFVLFLGYTAVYATGVLDGAALQIGHWLLYRPQTQLDCLFYAWSYVGLAQVSLFLSLILGAVCWHLRYRKRVLPYLFLLLLLGVGIESIGKQIFTLAIPRELDSGLHTLACPQIHGQPRTILRAAAGLWWELPAPDPDRVSQARVVAETPLSFDRVRLENTYPGGHALRWCFLGLVTSWLCWRHLKRPWLRLPLMIFALVLAFAGGFWQFYIGVHYIPDTFAGYLLGAALACWAIGLLVLNKRASEKNA